MMSPDYAAQTTLLSAPRRLDGPEGLAKLQLRTQVERIITRAGLEPWPRLFHNLRASRETEVAERVPIQVVSEWLGNTPDIAQKHYLQTTDEHCQRALEPAPNSPPPRPAIRRASLFAKRRKIRRSQVP